MTQAGTNSNQVPGTQGERAWRGMLMAMLRSPRIVHLLSDRPRRYEP